MTHSQDINASGETEQSRRPRVVILGEFSAGKSTLINLFTEGNNLRTQVTATQMPPVWISYGAGDPIRVDLDGNEHPVDPSDPDSISVSDTLYVRTFMEAPMLKAFDLIDTPGNSDPNIASEAWERAAALADIAIWCSSSTQAWRQSELSAWKEVPEAVRARSILLLTRADKITSDEDRAKVLNRVKREAGDLFTHIHMASLLKLENTRDVLADLVALAGSSNQAVTTTSAQSQDEARSEAPTEVKSAEKASAPTGDDLSDDMLIDSLDLTGESNLDEFGLNGGEDADMDAVLAALTIGAPAAATAVASASPSKADSTELKSTAQDIPKDFEEAFTNEPNSSEELSAEGFASELWRVMSTSVSPDDADAYSTAFDLFLEKVDTEIAMLRGQLNTQAVG